MQNQPNPHLQAALQALDKGIAEQRKMIDQMIAEYKEETRFNREQHKKKLAAERANLKKQEKSRSILTGEKPARKPRTPKAAAKEAVA